MTKPSDAAEAALDGDAAAAAAARRQAGTWPVQVIDHFASLGDQPPLRALCGAVIAVGLFGGDRRLVRTGLRMLTAHTAATLAKDFVKARVDRTRPRSARKPGKDHRPRAGKQTAKEETSFPSGHTAGAVAVAGAFAREYPEHRLPAYAAASALSLAQIPRSAHYPTDVAAGAALGAAAELLVSAAFKLVPGGHDSAESGG